ncbi:SusC/RagA family TonB-linked outer membrane protein [Tenacibaculum sp.]|nr:SusC/RagA family TonB-linked outer membrane protein [Tenacibaculum sp.]
MLTYNSLAQEKTITGVVTSQADGLPLPGVSIVIKGTTKGTETNFDGKYNIKASQGDLLTFSFVGMETISITVGNNSTINVQLEEGTILDEVVVTALGIKKEAKKLGYSIQTLKGDNLSKVNSINVANAISGKVTGVQINQNGSGVSGSSAITIRGISSLVPGQNSPLLVVDGVILDNGSLGQGGFSGGLDYGNAYNDINPDDIQSVNILKGGNATALYGYRGAGGVIVITTKSGKSGDFKVEFNSTSTFDNVLTSPQFQNSYGQGTYNAATGQLEYDIQRSGSWGPKLDGSLKQNFDGVGTAPYSSQSGDFKDFYTTGNTFTNSIAVSGGSDKTSYRLSYTNLYNTPILKGSNFKRNSISLNTISDISDKFKVQAKISYVKNTARNRPDITDGQANTVRGLILKPRNISNANLAANYINADGTPKNYGGGAFTMNPYYAINTKINEDYKNRYTGLLSLTYKFTSDLSATARYSQDQSSYSASIFQPIGAFDRAPTGGLVEITNQSTFTNYDLLVSYDKNLSEKLSLSSTLGFSAVENRSKTNRSQANDLLDSDLFSINNFGKKNVNTLLNQSKSQSIFGSVQFGYNDYAFWELTARNDWSSTLPVKNASFFYPSAGASFLLDKIFDIQNDNINRIKLRASAAQTGNATSPHLLSSVFNVSSNTYSGLPLLYLGNIKLDPGAAEEGAAAGYIIPNGDLVAELSTEYEVGVDASLFDNRLGLDFTYYNKNTKNQILEISLPPTSGAQSKLINAGLVNNSGFEVALTGTPIKNENFKWNTSFNFTKNKNKIVELSPDLPSTIIARQFNDDIQLVATEGRLYGDLVGSTFRRDANGNKVYDSNGLPIVGANDVIGNVTPDFLLGINNTLTYKNFELDFLIDIKSGGDVFSFTDKLAASQGTDEITLAGREFYSGGNGIMVPANATIDGTLDPAIAARGVDPQTYYGRLDNISENWVSDASFVKLRQLSLTYKLPLKFLKKLSISKASISYVGRNLAILHKNTKNFDPEVGFNTSIQGIEFFDMPSTSSHGLKLAVSF